MTRISEEILNNVDIVDVIGKYVQLKKAGSNFSGKCPFHNEKTPSFMVSPQKQIFKCFGCGIGWNVITFIKEIERIDFWDAAKILAKEGNIDLKQYENNYHKHAEMNQWKEKIKRLHKLSQNFFVEALKNSEKATKYLKEERKLDEKTIKAFGIGYAPNSHYELLQAIKNKWFKDEDLQEASLAKRWQSGDSFSFFRNRITFPIFDTMGNVVAFSARIIDPKDQPKYLNSSEHQAFEKSKILYGLHLVKQHIKEFWYIIVVEWQMDVIALYQLGYPIAVATSWTAVTPEHIKLIKRYTDNVYFLFDNDEAGQKATLRALKIAYQQDVFPKLIWLPEKYKDVDNLAQELDGKEQFKRYLDEAIDAFLSIYKRLKSKIDITSPVDKQKLMNAMFELIIWLPNPSTQIHYLSVLADAIGQSDEVMNAQYKQYVANEGQFTIRQQQREEDKKKSSIYQPSREDILASLFYQDFLLDLIKKEQEWEKNRDDKEIFAKKILAIGKTLAKILPQSYLAEIIQNEDKLPQENLRDAQLWWEKELENMASHEDKLKTIKRIISSSMKQLIQQVRKATGVSAEEKRKLFTDMNEIKR